MKIKPLFNSLKKTALTSLKKEKKSKIIAFAILIFLIILSTVVKVVVEDNLKSGGFLEITSTLGFAYKLNTGISFGLLDSEKELAVAFQVIISLFTTFGILFAAKKEYIFGFLLISAGGLSNITDRFDDGAIVDYLTFDKSVYFNVSDTYVILGILFIIYALFISTDDDDESVRKLGWRKKKDSIKK